MRVWPSARRTPEVEPSGENEEYEAQVTCPMRPFNEGGL